jgi:adenosine deaminase
MPSQRVELHCHVAGSVRPATMRAFVEADGLEPRLWQIYACAADGEGLSAYLARFAAWDATVTSPERLYQVVAELREDLAADGVAYAELRLRPPTDDDAAWDALLAAATEAGGCGPGPRIAFLSVLVRGWDRSRALREARRAARWAGRGVVGIDVAGDESRDRAAPLADAVRLAREAGLGVTAHAGEGAGPESVWQALQLFQPDRIAHGVRSVEDPSLVAALRERRIHLEMAPTSNVHTGCVRHLADHPFGELLRAGVSVSLNTDNRAISGTTLSAEYAGSGLSEPELERCLAFARDAAFG